MDDSHFRNKLDEETIEYLGQKYIELLVKNKRKEKGISKHVCRVGIK